MRPRTEERGCSASRRTAARFASLVARFSERPGTREAEGSRPLRTQSGRPRSTSLQGGTHAVCRYRSGRSDHGAIRTEPVRGARAKLDGLTGIRALAALWIVAYHYTTVPFHSLATTNAVPIVNVGYLAVDLFFILSGFVIWHVYGAELSRLRPKGFVRFLCLRLARLYPVHLATIGVLAALVWLGPRLGVPVPGPAYFTRHLLMLHLLLVRAWVGTRPIGWNYPSWSVSAEWFCYLLFPAIAMLIARSGKRGTVGSIVLVLIGIDALCVTAFGSSMNQTVGPPALLRAGPEFLLGCLLRRLRGQVLLERWPWTAISLGALALWVLSLAKGLPAGVLGIPLFAALVLAASTDGTAIAAILGARPLVAAGVASYSLYLVQVPVYTALGGLQPSLARADAIGSAAIVAVYLIALAGATVAMHRCIEAPSRRWLRRRIETWLPRSDAKPRRGAAGDRLAGMRALPPPTGAVLHHGHHGRNAA